MCISLHQPFCEFVHTEWLHDLKFKLCAARRHVEPEHVHQLAAGSNAARGADGSGTLDDQLCAGAKGAVAPNVFVGGHSQPAARSHRSR